MRRAPWIGGMGVVLLGTAAVLAVFLLTRPGSGAPGRWQPAPVPPESAFPEARPAAPDPPVPPAWPAQADPQPPGSVATFDSPEDRADAMAELQRQRLRSGMDGLNQRGARRAALARPAPPPAGPTPSP